MIESTARPSGSESLKLAVSKGRVLEQCLPLLEAADIVPLENPSRSRKLVLDTNEPTLKLVIIRSQDVPTYVEYGAADFGIVGKDVLLEHEGDGLYEPLDLQIAKCRLVVAGKPQARHSTRRLRIATKYERTAKAHFAGRGIQAEIIHLYGSMELAPLVELADQIVDLVETGSTLRANGLVEFESIAEISTRLVVNKASMKMKHDLINGYIDKLRAAVDASACAPRAAMGSTD